MPHRSAITAALIALSLAACGERAPEEPAPAEGARVSLTQGEAIGFVGEAGAHVWRGLPFAAAPEGDLRWRAPRPAEAWTGIREALGFGNICPQITTALDRAYDLDPGTLWGSEDCLYLDVYAPPEAEGAPVMVWIHGGANTWGRSRQYDGSHLAMGENVVVVVIQYRLGPLGWLAHPALRDAAEHPDDLSANFATLDMIAALEWVRDNASAFGGDPGNVTVFGESAGGRNVASLLASPRASGLFHRAIIQSGVVGAIPLDEAEGAAPGQANSGLVAAERFAGPSPTADTMRAAPLVDVFEAFRGAQAGFRLDVPQVIADGVVLPLEGEMAAFASPGAFNAVPVITGANRDETKLFNLLDERFTRRWFGVLYQARDPRMYDLISEYQSRAWRILAVNEVADLMTAGGHGDVWAYRFDWDEQSRFLFSDFSRLMGAAHGLEIPFVFGRFQFLGSGDRVTFTRGNREGREALSGAMMSYWAQFARTGDPGTGGGDHARWERWGGESATMILDSPADGGARMEAAPDSLEALTRDLSADTRLTDEERCLVFNASVAWWPTLEAHRSALGDGFCPAAG